VETGAEFVSGNTYKKEIQIEKSGIWEISATFDGKLIRGIKQVTLMPGPVTASNTVISCPGIIPAMSIAQCSIQARDQYNNVLPKTLDTQSLFLGNVVFQQNSLNANNHMFNPRVTMGINQGEYLLKYRSPTQQSSLTVSVFLRSTSASGAVIIKPVNNGVFNVTVKESVLNTTLSNNVCDESTVEAGKETTCRIRVEQADSKGPVIDPSYASALRAVIVSESGEQTIGTIEYSGLGGIFIVKFTLTRIGKAKITIEYALNNNYAVLDNTQEVQIYSGPISVLHSKVQCIPGATVWSL
jgi:hypothetical protein